MSGKQPASVSIASAPKKTRKSITLEVKLDVLRRFDAGVRAVDISKDLGLKPTTVRTIHTNAEKIKRSARSINPASAARITKGRDSVMVNMERLLNMWIDDHSQRNVLLSLAMIQEKARSIFEELKKEHSEGLGSGKDTFSASRGWFERFKRRSNLYNAKGVGEDGNVDVEETGLLLKRTPSHTYISEKEKTASAINDHLNHLSSLVSVKLLL